jgi:VanZ family protein
MTRATRLFWFALLCWAGGILWLSSLTPQELPEAAFIAWDKINHVLAYAVGGWLAAGALRLSRPLAPVAGRIVLAVVMVAAFGIVDESLQALTPGRTGGDIGDWIADVLGAGAGAVASIPSQRRLHRRPAA